MKLDEKKVKSASSSKEVKCMIAERWNSLGNEEKQICLNQADERNEKYLKRKEELKRKKIEGCEYSLKI